jgi:hypothetical protein
MTIILLLLTYYGNPINYKSLVAMCRQTVLALSAT